MSNEKQGAGAAREALNTTDAMVWARAFIETLHSNVGLDPTDEGWMFSWFANAIETGRSAGHQAERDADHPPCTCHADAARFETWAKAEQEARYKAEDQRTEARSEAERLRQELAACHELIQYAQHAYSCAARDCLLEGYDDTCKCSCGLNELLDRLDALAATPAAQGDARREEVRQTFETMGDARITFDPSRGTEATHADD